MKLSIVAIAITLASTSSALTKSEADSMHVAIKAVCPLLFQDSYERQLLSEENAHPSASQIHLAQVRELQRIIDETREQLSEARKENAAGVKVFRDNMKSDIDLGFCTTWQSRHPEDF